jgi:hypothetical protein
MELNRLKSIACFQVRYRVKYEMPKMPKVPKMPKIMDVNQF